MKLEDIDIVITARAELRPKMPLSMSDRILLEQEETRINYYLDHLADIIEQKLRRGEKFNMQNFMELDSPAV